MPQCNSVDCEVDCQCCKHFFNCSNQLILSSVFNVMNSHWNSARIQFHLFCFFNHASLSLLKYSALSEKVDMIFFNVFQYSKYLTMYFPWPCNWVFVPIGHHEYGIIFHLLVIACTCVPVYKCYIGLNWGYLSVRHIHWHLNDTQETISLCVECLDHAPSLSYLLYNRHPYIQNPFTPGIHHWDPAACTFRGTCSVEFATV